MTIDARSAVSDNPPAQTSDAMCTNKTNVERTTEWLKTRRQGSAHAATAMTISLVAGFENTNENYLGDSPP
jgi:hypothetical protein